MIYALSLPILEFCSFIKLNLLSTNLRSVLISSLFLVLIDIFSISLNSKVILQGLALNLEKNTVSVLLMDQDIKLQEGFFVNRTGNLVTVPTGFEILGRIINPLGVPIDGKENFNENIEKAYIEIKAPGIIARKSVFRPLQTGIKAVDSMLPIGRGQRELIIGDRQTGKTAIAVASIINQAKINKKIDER